MAAKKTNPLDIRQQGDPVLRSVATPVTPHEFSSAALTETLRLMTAALEQHDDGVGIAAPQIGIGKRIFLVSWRAFAIEDGHEDLDKARRHYQNRFFINPEIIKSSKRMSTLSEGCLSVRWLYGNVRRAEKATIRALDEHGKSFTYGGSGLLAQIFQHEVDHLNGVLFIDTATDVEDIPPEKMAALQEARERKRHTN